MKNFNFILSGSSLALSIIALVFASITAATGPSGSNGATGPQGETGLNGSDGTNGSDGQDGETPYIGDNGNWFIGETDTGVSATGLSNTSYSPYASFENEIALENWLILQNQEQLLNALLDFNNIGDYVNQRVLEGYVEISDAISLLEISDPTGRYVLSSDIDLSAVANWSPIVFAEGFQGTLDGAGFTLSGLTTATIDPSYGRANIGLFAMVKNATLKNIQIEDFDFTTDIASDSAYIGALTAQSYRSYFHHIDLTNCSISGYSFVGGLVGYSSRSIIDNISSLTEVRGTSYIGGIAGESDDSSWTQILTSASSEVIGKEYAVGGVVGGSENSTFITVNAYGEVSFDGTSSAITSALGGVFGFLYNVYALGINNYASVVVPAENQTNLVVSIGGIAGFASYSHFWTVRNWGVVLVLYENDATYETVSVGGLVGDFQDSLLISSYNNANVAVVYEENQDQPAPLSSYIGGLIGYQRNQGLILGCANNGTVIGFTEVGGVVGGTGFLITIWCALEIYQTANLGAVVGHDQIGGIIGSIDGYFYFHIQDSFNQGYLYGQSVIGGLVGSVATNNGSVSYIRNSFNAGNLYGELAMGGLVGVASQVLPEPATGMLFIEHSFNLGLLTSPLLGLGYLDYQDEAIGSIYGVRSFGGTMTNVLHPIYSEEVEISVYDADLDQYVLNGEVITMLLPSVGSGYPSGAVMVNGEDAFQEDAFHYSDVWDMENIWGFDDASDYPKLRHNPIVDFAG